MARTTAEDCLEYITNRYDLVLVAAKRARQISVGMAKPMVEDEEKFEKSPVISLREIGEGKINSEEITMLEQETEQEPTQIDFESILRGFEETDREMAAKVEEGKPEEDKPSAEETKAKDQES